MVDEFTSEAKALLLSLRASHPAAHSPWQLPLSPRITYTTTSNVDIRCWHSLCLWWWISSTNTELDLSRHGYGSLLCWSPGPRHKEQGGGRETRCKVHCQYYCMELAYTDEILITLADKKWRQRNREGTCCTLPPEHTQTSPGTKPPKEAGTAFFEAQLEAPEPSRLLPLPASPTTWSCWTLWLQ